MPPTARPVGPKCATRSITPTVRKVPAPKLSVCESGTGGWSSRCSSCGSSLMRASWNSSGPLGYPVLNQAQSDDAKERDNECGHECKRHLSPDATAELAILKVGPGVKGNECHCAGAEPTGEVVVGSFDTLMGHFVANDTYEVNELNAPPPHCRFGHVGGKVPLDKINRLLENAPIGVECHNRPIQNEGF